VTVLPIRLLGDPVLRTPATTVTVFDKQLRMLVADLTDSMLSAPGVGLAAPQLGVGLRIFTYHIDDVQSGHLINPSLHFPSEEDQDGPEGCLSIPGVTVDCRRKRHVVAHGQNMWGDPILVEGTDMLARCVQHETDHLDGVLFLDRLDSAAKREAMQVVRESSWWADEATGASARGDQPAPPVFKLSPHPTSSATR
jgi:peptide deformylase